MRSPFCFLFRLSFFNRSLSSQAQDGLVPDKKQSPANMGSVGQCQITI